MRKLVYVSHCGTTLNPPIEIEVPETNYDRVMRKSPEEFAVWMNGVIKEKNIEVTCDGWLAWLNAEAGNEV